MKIPRENCVSYKDGKCLHQGAPRRLFGTNCILTFPSSDPRVIHGCALQCKFPIPKPPEGKP